jgi:hypothetical protein
VTSADLVLVLALVKPLEGIFANRLEHPEPRLVEDRSLRSDQAAIDQRGEPVEGCRARHCLGAVGAKAAGERREGREQRLLLGAEQVVAPLDGGAERAVPLRHGRVRRLQHVEPAAETTQDRTRSEQVDPCGGQFECERQAVQADAQLGDRVSVFAGQFELGSSRLCPLDEERDRAVGDEAVDHGDTRWVRKLERRNHVRNLPVDSEHDAARHEHGQRRRAFEKLAEERRRRRDLLEVVDDQQQLLRPQVCRQGVHSRTGRSDDACDLSEHDSVIGQRGERDDGGAVRVDPGQTAFQLEREPRLADASRPSERRQPRPFEERFDLAEDGLAADQLFRVRTRSMRLLVQLRVLPKNRELESS